MAWESSQEQRPGPRTRQQHRGLGFRPGRSPYLGALKYHGVVVAIPFARASPHSRSRVVFALSPLCRAHDRHRGVLASHNVVEVTDVICKPLRLGTDGGVGGVPLPAPAPVLSLSYINRDRNPPLQLQPARICRAMMPRTTICSSMNCVDPHPHDRATHANTSFSVLKDAIHTSSKFEVATFTASCTLSLQHIAVRPVLLAPVAPPRAVQHYLEAGRGRGCRGWPQSRGAPRSAPRPILRCRVAS